MPDNLVFLGIHFSVAKRKLFELLYGNIITTAYNGTVYAISLLITLNTRHSIHRRSRRLEGDSHQLPVFLPGSLGRRKSSFTARFPTGRHRQPTEPTSTQVSVNIERTVHFDIDVDSETIDNGQGNVFTGAHCDGTQPIGDVIDVKSPVSASTIVSHDDPEKGPSI